MSLTVFAPYGSKNPEGGLLYLIANYVRERGVKVSQLRCNGVFSHCDRDGEIGWTRNVSSCLACMHEQKVLSQWSSIAVEELSRYLSPDEVSASVRWVNSLQPNELMTASVNGAALIDIMRGSIAARFGIPAIDPRNRSHDAFARRILLATLRMLDASRRYCSAHQNEIILMAGGDNFMVQSFLNESRKTSNPCFLFKADFSNRCIYVTQDRTTDSYSCPLLIEEIGSLRSDVKTWAPDLIRLLDEVVAYLGVHIPPAVMPAVATAGR